MATTTHLPTEIDEWTHRLETLSWKDAVPAAQFAAVISTDMVMGFCQHGALASERVAGIIVPVVRLFEEAYAHGVEHFVLLQDTHAPETPEFRAFPRHCLRNTEETETVEGLQTLPFADRFTILEKNSLHPAIGTGFERWLSFHPEIDTAVVVGNCTDLCVYQVAMYLRLRANRI